MAQGYLCNGLPMVTAPSRRPLSARYFSTLVVTSAPLGITCHHVTWFASSSSFIILHHLRSITHASAKAIDKSKSYRMKQLSNRILLNNAHCTLDNFNQFEVFPFFCQRRQIHAGWICIFIKSKHMHAIHGSRMALLYLVKHRSKVGTFITVRKF